MGEMWRRFWCKLNLHPRLDVIQTFGSAQHIGCPYCRREFGIHHVVQAVIPWTLELDELYRVMGYDTAAASQRWRRYRV